ncbi:type VI secretion system lipoprotein TssJ [Geoalkalibacter sp.]|uniref:type VI secretion system lipoprotein TssJ n=1 Tax=Geoalkalibacter sp. TaxID=3041440 RepID=UPI00272EA911|nr:type VI secretion system lipoprotein TssJ [Geoalkalibacter sp.]
MFSRCFCVLVLMLSLFVLVGCADHRVRVSMSATGDLNLNETEDPLPVVVRIYQLNDDGEFTKAAFTHLWKDDLKALRGSLLTRDEVVMNPASQMVLDYPWHEQARFVAVMGVFRAPGDAHWRDVRPLNDGYFGRRAAGKIKVRFKNNTLEMVD